MNLVDGSANILDAALSETPTADHTSVNPVEQELKFVQARLTRAREHHAAFKTIWDEYLSQRPHRFRQVDRADGTTSITLHRNIPLPVKLSVVIGEILYQLRSALDTCLYSVAIIVSGQNPPPGGARLEWPIRTTTQDWDSQRKRYEHLPTRITEALEAIQPYQAQTPAWNCLQILHDLARFDRHRGAHQLGLYICELRITWDKEVIELVDSGGPRIIQDGDEVALVRLHEGALLTRKNFDLQCEFDPDIRDVSEFVGPGGTIGRPWGPLGQRLGAIIRAVEEYTDGLVGLAVADGEST